MARPRGTETVAPAKSGKTIRVTQVRSGIGYKYDQQQVLAGLGLRRPRSSVVLEDSPSIRGMCGKIPHLVRIDEVK